MKYLLFALLAISLPAMAQSNQTGNAEDGYKRPGLPYTFTQDGEARSPFADFDAMEKRGDPLSDLYDPLGQTQENSTALDKAHRSVNQLARWSEDTVSRALNTNTVNFNTHQETLRPYFTDSGWRGYQSFLQNEGLTQNLRGASPYSIDSFSIRLPELLGQGAAGGVHKWAFDVPMTYTRGPGLAGDRRRDMTQVDKETINVVVQLTRGDIDKKIVPDQVQIESWTVERPATQAGEN